MKTKKTLFQVLCPYKLTRKEAVIVGWFAISLAMLSVTDDAPVLFIILDAINFAVSSYCLAKFVKLSNDEEDV